MQARCEPASLAWAPQLNMHVCARLAKIKIIFALLREKYLEITNAFHQPYFSTRLKVVTLPKRFYFIDWACKSLVSFEALSLLSNTLSQSEETGAKTQYSLFVTLRCQSKTVSVFERSGQIGQMLKLKSFSQSKTMMKLVDRLL